MKVELDECDLAPIVERVVASVLAQREANDAQLGNGMAYTEQEAADVLRLTATQLRDIRKRGEIDYVLVSGRFVRYRRQDLATFMERNLTTGRR